MARRVKKSSTKNRAIKLKNALNSENLSSSLNSLTPGELYEFFHHLNMIMYMWLGEPTVESLEGIRDTLPLLNEFIDFDIVFQRVNKLDEIKRSTFGPSLREFFPELPKVSEFAGEVVASLPPGIKKAENWLLPIAKRASADADVEAAVYFASRGYTELLESADLRNRWHSAICFDVSRGRPVGTVAEPLLQRAREKTLSLAEAASALKFRGSLSRFFAFLDEEEDFIDAAMFRAVEWFGIGGFEPWLRSLVFELSVGPQFGIEHWQASWWLFMWCRSDLALQMADRSGLEAWLWAFINGSIERDKPWVQFNPDRENPSCHAYLPIAAAIPFVWHRIKPTGMSSSILNRATEMLLQSQLPCGAWPMFSTNSEGNLMTTSLAIHGLAMHKPRGWRQAVERAALWLESKQSAGGEWYVQGGPSVMITVLVLDALSMARETGKLTFNLSESSVEAGGSRNELTLKEQTAEHSIAEEPVYDFSSFDWFEPEMPCLTSVDLSKAMSSASPDVALVVATEIELLQTLRLMTPLPRKHRLWKVMHDCDTYYLGRFGAFVSVVALSTMGSFGAGGSTLCVDSTIRTWTPRAILLPGIAFGSSRKKHGPGNVLIAEHIIPYEKQRIGDETIFRNPVPPTSAVLLNRFRNAMDWTFALPDGSYCKRHVGPLFSGEKLVDNLEFKEYLLQQYPNAIGGEMEGAGLWSAASRHRTEWIVVKGVCDWGDGKKHKEFQSLAAAASVSLCHHILADTHSLDGL